MDRLADVSLVLETANIRTGRRIGLQQVLDAWRRQTRADRLLEWVVVSSSDPAAERRSLFQGLPVRWLVEPAGEYFRQKNAGLAQARGSLVALADADVLPAADWLERALEVLDHADARVALVTGRSRYLPGPFSREMAIAQMPNQSEHPREATHFLAHNVLLRADIARSLGFFREEAIRLGPDTDLAERLIAAGYRLAYDPELMATHNFPERVGGVYRSTLLTGYAFGLFEQRTGRPRPNPFLDFAGRVRTLLSRLRQERRGLGIPVWRLPLSLLFFVAYSAAFEHGRRLALRGEPKP